jgi:hypothetical protein
MPPDKDLLWLKFIHGIGDRIHHIAQAMQRAEEHDVQFLVDMRDPMFSPDGSDVFQRYFSVDHPAFVSQPDWEGLENEKDRTWVPENREVFKQKEVLPLRLCGPWLFIPGLNRPVFRTWKSVRWLTKLGQGHRCHWRLHPDFQFHCPIGHQLHIPSAEGRTNWLYVDMVLPKTDSHRIARILPRKEMLNRIEAQWAQDAFHPRSTLGIHIRQTDKSQDPWWQLLIEKLLREGQHGNSTGIFVATDSWKVQQAFRTAGFAQPVYFSPWTPLEPGEKPLHLSATTQGIQALESALFDLWTLTLCQHFVPTQFSSFSRVVDAWRQAGVGRKKET